MKARQRFDKGMSQDPAKDKRDPSSYYYMNNFRVVTEDGSSTGSLENEKGHILAFTVPDLPQMTLGNGDIIPAQSDLRIIGWCTIVDEIIIFTTNEVQESPVNGYGQIWRVEFDENTGTIPNLLTGSTLDPTIHLIYTNKINFTSYHRIGRAVGSYENKNTKRVYWTDNYNPVRTINIADPDVANLDPANLDIQPGTRFIQPTVLDVGSGSLPEGTMVQFSYRLIDTAGAETLYAPCTPLIPLTAYGFHQTDFGGFQGDGIPSVLSKSVTYKLVGLDTDYEVIEHVIIVYTGYDVKKIYKFNEELVPASGNLQVTCTTLNDAIEIPLIVFNILASGFNIAKDIEVKSRKLIAANTKTKYFDIKDFDARAYRSRIAGDFDIYDGSGIATSFIADYGSDYSNIPDIHDAINIYNDESRPTWSSTDQFKYQINGTTLGGTGPNISYEFTKLNIAANYRLNHPTTAPNHIDLQPFVSGSNFFKGILEGDGSPKLITSEGQFPNMASQYGLSDFGGYARGETYRFGIVFYSKQGSTSFVKWIGDIRFPDVEDGFPIQENVGGIPIMYQLGIRFTVDVSSVFQQISGYSIVRVKRDEPNRTKIGSGMLMYFDIQDRSYNHTLLHRWETTGPNTQPADPDNPYEITDQVSIYGNLTDSCFHLADKPGFQWPQLTSASSKSLCYMITPLGQLYPLSFKTGDYIRTRGYYSGIPVLYGGDQGVSEGDRSYAFYYKLIDYNPNPYDPELFQIDKIKVMEVGEFVFSGSDIMTGSGNNLRNASYCKDRNPEVASSHVPLGLGSPKLALSLSTSPTIPNNTGDPTDAVGDAGSMRWLGSDWILPQANVGDPGTNEINFNGGSVSNTTVYFKEVVYARYLVQQYSGNTYVARSRNQYMSTGHFQVTEDLAALTTVMSFNVYGGDTFINYFDDEQIQFFWNQSTAYNQPYKEPDSNKLSVVVCAPVETYIDVDYREGRHWAASRDASNMGAYESNDWTYRDIWTQPNNTEEKFFALDFLINLVEEHPHQLWASETKIDGELIDSWRVFKPNNSTEVTGIYGPINRIINFKDRLYFYQDRAFGIASIDERSIVNDTSGQAIVLGTGGVFPYFSYISTNTGSYHQFGVISSENALYHYDARLKKIFAYNGNAPEGLSDLKGMSSFFDKGVQGDILKSDHTLKEIGDGSVGIHAEVDFRYNRVLFTFLKNMVVKAIEDYYVGSNTYTFPSGSYVFDGENIYYIPSTISITGVDARPPDLSLTTSAIPVINPGFTISYNEMLGAFESFYDYVPGIYLQYGRRLMSVSPFERNKSYIHNEGVMCTYYDQPTYPSVIQMIFSAREGNSIFNNLSYTSELTDSSGVDIYNESFNSIQIKNEYQDTGLLVLDNTNLKRRMRTWRYEIPRDSDDGISRMRNPWVDCTMIYDNNNNKRHVLHEIIYSYTPAKM